jgi:hypothetical protein
LLLRFLLTMPSEVAKKARKCRMKWCSVIESLFRSVVLAARSISSAVQKEAFSSCTSSRCRYVGWGRGQNDGNSFGEVAQQQVCL